MIDIIKELSKKPSYPHWQSIGIYKHHGILIPLSGLRTKKSSGIGEYKDLKLFIDWCKDIGIDVIQLLPLNEMGIDCSPYNSISSIALDPIYLSLWDLPYINKFPSLLSRLDAFKKLNLLKRVNFLEVKHKKNAWLQEYFEKAYPFIENTSHYQTFIKQNSWLQEYGLFCVFKNQFPVFTCDLWPEKYHHLSKKSISAFIKRYEEKIKYYSFLQYLCFLQMEDVKKYATENKRIILGDIPILISRNSVDVWHEKKLFDLSHSAGCPPDNFNKLGQNWGFPLFNWEAMAKDDFSWWKRRLNVASSCYHMYRLDHVLGFFRIWAMKTYETPHKGKYIPQTETEWQDYGKKHLQMLLNSSSMLPIYETPTQGRFIPKDEKKWPKQGKEHLLMVLNASLSLPIAEDLGLIPTFVYDILKELGLCGIKIMTWQKEKNGKFLSLDKYEPLSLTTLSTHDSPLIDQWWQENPKEAEKWAFHKNWKYSPVLTKEQRKSFLYDSHHTSSLFHVNILEEYLGLHDELSWDSFDYKRINRPGIVSKKNWNYRTKPYLEEIVKHKALAADIKEIISA